MGGGASESQVQKAFELLNADKAVKAILVNIFGGIMRCDVIAMGVINAAQNIGMKKPIIIRLKGTNVEVRYARLDGLPRQPPHLTYPHLYSSHARCVPSATFHRRPEAH